MDVLELLESGREATVDEALEAVGWLTHYGRDGESLARARLVALHGLVEQALRTRDLTALVSHASAIAAERHAAGYERAEVVSAVTALEEALWHRVRVGLAEPDRAWALALVGTALSHARQALVEAFAELSRGDRADFVDLSPLFRGTGRRAGDRYADDLVHPV